MHFLFSCLYGTIKKKHPEVFCMSVITIKSSELEVKIKTLGAKLTSVKDNSGREYI